MVVVVRIAGPALRAVDDVPALDGAADSAGVVLSRPAALRIIVSRDVRAYQFEVAHEPQGRHRVEENKTASNRPHIDQVIFLVQIFRAADGLRVKRVRFFTVFEAAFLAQLDEHLSVVRNNSDLDES